MSAKTYIYVVGVSASEADDMLGSRFDLNETLDAIAAARGSLDAHSAETGFEEHGTAEERSVVRENERHAIEVSCRDLESEMVALAHTVHRRSTRMTFKCPVCDSVMDVSEEQSLSEFGALDIKLHRLVCDNCGMSTGRAFHPSVGYRALAR